MSDHAWVQENITSYATSGLSAAEVERLEKHTARCPDCAGELAQWRGLEQTLEALFAGQRPAAGLEDRLIDKLRAAPPLRWWRRSLVLRWAAALAAVVFLGLLGAGLHGLVVEDILPFPGEASNNLKPTWLSLLSVQEKMSGPRYHTTPKFSSRISDETVSQDPFLTADLDVEDGKYMVTRRLEVLTKNKDQRDLAGWDDVNKGKELQKRFREEAQQQGQKQGQEKEVQIEGASKESASGYMISPPSSAKPATITPPGTMPSDPRLPPGRGMGGMGSGMGGMGGMGMGIPGELPPGPVAKTEEYFKLTTDALDKAGKTADDKTQKPANDPFLTSDKEPAKKGKIKDEKKPLEDALGTQKSADQAKPDNPEPAPVSRKIIRTGEIEFEVEGFDTAVDNVTRLINGIKGGFVATINSEKLPNGKVRGSVVVRMPPEFLDKFLLDLRKELAKFGELKGQRIGSLDVTKQYYDLESRLRAARTMEDRLLNIIKTGKGEIKDLLNAERELGVWRTKIEEMEGEIRYYHNQVSLSTLTITLYEKEIRAPSALVVTERLNVRLEVEDVDKAYQTALAAIAKAKGRVTKADLRQHAAGQLEAILQFEVAPTETDNLRTLLRGLGHVVHQDVERLQQAEGGSGRPQDGKTRHNDTQFHVVMYNVANIGPRQTFTLQLDAADVPAGFRKLQEAVDLVKGQVRSGNLNEQDALNVSAQFDFDVPSAKRDIIEKVLAELGEVFSRTQAQASPSETATDRKIGYRVTFRNVAGVPPRETQNLQIDAANVPEGYRQLQAAVAQAKGFVRGGNLNEQDKLNISAQFDFDLPSAKREEVEKTLAAIGEVFSRSATQAPPGQTATDRKIGYRVTFRNMAGIPPRETFNLQIAALDVADAFRKLQEAVAKVKGQVATSQLNEQEKLNMNAQLDFDIPSAKADRDIIDKALAEVGEVLTRSTTQVPPGQAASERKVGYRLVIKSTNAIQPREKVTLTVEVKDVDQAAARLIGLVEKSKGVIPAAKLTQDRGGRTLALLLFNVPYSAKDELVREIKAAGVVRDQDATRDHKIPQTKLATAHIDVTLTSAGPIVPSDEGLWLQIRTSLFYSFKLLSWSLMFIILGLSVVLPWALVLWGASWLMRRWRKKAAGSAA